VLSLLDREAIQEELIKHQENQQLVLVELEDILQGFLKDYPDTVSRD